MKRFLGGSLAVAFALLTSAALAASASASTIYVEKSGADGMACGSQAAPCLTINGGIPHANPGDTVKVGTGTFTEQVVIATNITLRGDGLSSTVIASPATLTTQFITTGPNRPVVHVDATGSGSTVADLTIDGKGQGNANNRIVGLGVNNAGATARHIRIVRVRNQPLDGAQGGSGILAVVDNTVARTLTVDDVTIADFQKAGVVATGAGLTANVVNSTIQGQGATDQIAQNGVQIGGGATGSVSGSDISGFACTAPSCGPGGVVSTGLLLSGASSGTAVTDNTLTDNDVSVYGDGLPSLDVTGNDISGTNATGIIIYGGGGDIATTGNVTGNSITGQDIGVAVYDGGTGPNQPRPAISLNRIVGNQVGVYTDTPQAVNALKNWWGCNGGPGTAGCDPVQGPVDYDPWLVFRATASPASISSGGAVSTIRGRLDQDSSGAALNTASFPREPVSFSTTLGDIDPLTTMNGGIARSTLSSGDTNGTASTTATFDGQGATTQVQFVSPQSSPAGPTGAQGAAGPQGLPGASTPPAQGEITPIVITNTTLKPDKKGRVSLKLRCPTAAGFCDGRFTLKAGRKALGAGVFLVQGGKSSTVRVKLNAKAIKTAAKSKKVGVSLFSRDSVGKASRTEATLKFRKG